MIKPRLCLRIIALLKAQDRPMNIKEISRFVDANGPRTYSELIEMRAMGLIAQTKNDLGQYYFTFTNNWDNVLPPKRGEAIIREYTVRRKF